MSAIAFYIQKFLLLLLSFLPMGVLYIIADILYFSLYRVFSYRLKVVRDNIDRSFPGKTSEEKARIEKAFYRHFADMLMESVKMIHLSPDSLAKRMKLLNPEILDKYRSEGRSIVAMGAHYGNWEWTLGIVKELNYMTLGVYKPLNDRRFNDFVNHTRARFGAVMVNMREVIRVLIKLQKQKVPSFNVFIADQSPVWEEIQYWTPFLNQLTAVYLGPEKIAKQFNMLVLYGKVRKISRGMYTIELIPLEENPQSSKEFEITRKFISILEENILEAPEYWLWSHRRWKLTRKRENEERKGNFRFSENNTRI
ncbi:MAG: lysophospholipid acyltransferase family protein [Bacteroidales bacterium]|nr:lysophospholipid acyltransferase family protein [Bacteroidales bacterium]MCB8999365.1 lysophospholipid acyltransferase family protein [Bacteroidales bacterium]MCB9013392.1 lysophospholipid acyltransferase family protein [Bacteroidales bacterium]